MKSTTGAHYLALDHVRALAALLVVVWHFTHWVNGSPVPFEGAPLLPFAIFDEGHTGVALFMTLSGYLFAKLIGSREIIFSAFLWNRALRLLPLLAVVVVAVGVQRVAEGHSLIGYISQVAQGVLRPSLPNGGWSITAEGHFYVLLPLLLWTVRRSKGWLLAVLLAAICLRAAMFTAGLDIRALAYPTIIGRLDQFVLGILLFHLRNHVRGRHGAAAAAGVTFLVAYWLFDLAGGYYQAPRAVWVMLPTIEGAAYAFLIAWYDSSFTASTGALSRTIGRFGELSYSIYLLHFFFVAQAAEFVHRQVMDLSNFYVAACWAVAFFVAMYVPAAISYRFIESPALRLRKPYLATAVRPVPPQERVGSGA